MSSISHQYEMEAGTSRMLETCHESSVLIETVDTIVADNDIQGEKYFVVTEVDGGQSDLVEISGVEKLDGDNSVEENQPWAEICRVCASSSDHLIPIFEGEGLEHEISIKIQRYLPIQVCEDDSLPVHLCYHCAATLLAWHELVDGCLDAEQRLLRMQTELEEKHQADVMGESLDEGNGASTTDDTRVSIKDQLSEEELVVKGECNEESATTDSERSRGAECDASSLQTSKAEIDASSNQDTLEYVECGECEATFIEIPHLVTHMNSEHNDFVHYCTRCKMVFRGNEDAFKRHEIIHTHAVNAENTTARIGFCSLCNQSFNSTAELNQHVDEKHIFNEHKSYSCNSCKKVFARKSDLRQHIRARAPCNVHDDAKYIESKEEAEILRNAKVVVDDRCLYKCNTCQKHILTKRGFLRHTRIHTGNRPCRCNICGNQYRIKQDLARHVRDVHEGIKKYRCEICARPFANKGAKEDHQRIHTGERPYSCKLCKKTFRTLNSIYIHNRIHTNYKPHKCPSCDKQFPSRQRLNNHMTTHTGIKKFSCEICFKLFSVKGEVARHMAIHSQEKPFACTSCGMKFGQKRYLRNHIKQHHKDQSTVLLAKLTSAPH